MTGVDWWAAVAASLASASLGLRGNMLKPQFTSWSSAPAAVYLSVMLSSLTMGIAAFLVFTGAHASAREALAYTGTAVAGVVLLVNLEIQHRADLRKTAMSLLADTAPGSQ